jgi:cell division protein FtsI/penicillin-binding protein 2
MNNRRLLPFQGWRLLLTQVIIVFSLMLLLVRMAELQFMQGASFEADSEENRLQLVLKPAPRGVILDRYGVSLAPIFSKCTTACRR